MNYQCDEARLSAEEIAEIRRNMEIRGLSHVFCQACSEEMIPEQARKSATTGLIMCRPCYMCNDMDATQEEIDQALEEDFPGYLASFNQAQAFDTQENRANSKDDSTCKDCAFQSPAKTNPPLLPASKSDYYHQQESEQIPR